MAVAVCMIYTENTACKHSSGESRIPTLLSDEVDFGAKKNYQRQRRTLYSDN